MSDHYERLGVPVGAGRDEIRLAYRRLARQHHPDRGGEGSAVQMAQINEAWRVLSDPARRAVYDAQHRGGAGGSAARPGGREPSGTTGTARSATSTSERLHHGTAAPTLAVAPARFPWRFMVGVAVAGILFVLVNAALTREGGEPVPDNLMEVGSCVDILDNGDAKEVLCGGPYDGVVADLRPVESICPQRTELHRDRQGMGDVCVRLTTD